MSACAANAAVIATPWPARLATEEPAAATAA
jgi:hypothetical protein